MTDSNLQQTVIQDPRYRDSFKGVMIYGVAGTNGSGKDSLMEVLVEHGFWCFNVSDDLRKIAQAVLQSTERGGNDTPMGRVGNAIRSSYPGGPVDLGLLDWWLRIGTLPAELHPKGLVMGSIRTVSEAQRLKAFGGKLIVVEADPHVRYARLTGRGRADDGVTFEQFMDKENQELAPHETDPTKFGMAQVFAMADIRMENNGNDIAAFKAAAAQALSI